MGGRTSLHFQVEPGNEEYGLAALWCKISDNLLYSAIEENAKSVKYASNKLNFSTHPKNGY
jgi:hypothetical protein